LPLRTTSIQFKADHGEPDQSTMANGLAHLQCMDFFRAYRECKGKWVSVLSLPVSPAMLYHADC
jgi:hypothetical protein